MKKTVWKNVWQTAIALAIPVCVWLVVWASVGNDFIVPSFSASVKAFFAYLGTGVFWKGLCSTLLRVLLAFLFSCVLAGGLAWLAYAYPLLERIFAPVVTILRVLPVFAVVFLLLVWTDAGSAPVLVAFLSLFPTLYAAFLGALHGVDEGLIEMSRAYQVPLRTRIVRLYLPSIAPRIARDTGAALSFAVKLVVSAEVLVRTKDSLGNLMQETQTVAAQLPELFALVIAVCIVGFLLEALGRGVAKALEGGRK